MNCKAFMFTGCMIILLSYGVVFHTANADAASFFDTIGKTAKKVGKEIASGAKQVGKEVGLVEDKPQKQAAAAEKPAEEQPTIVASSNSAEPLPSAVTSRLSKMTRELDQSEQAFERNGGNGDNRTATHLKKARGLQDEINKQYADQFSPDHPEVVVVFDRLKQLEAKQSGGGPTQTAAATPPTTTQPTGASCDDWNAQFEIYTQGDKPLHIYATDDAALMSQWKSYNDEATALLNQFRSSPLGNNKCSRTEGTIQQLDRYMENFAAVYATYEAKHATAAANKGEIVFSSSPINAVKPSDLTESFTAGDNIYGLIRTTKPLSEIYKSNTDAKVRVDVKLDGKMIHAQFMMLSDAGLIGQQYLLFDIAPDPKKMKAYSTAGLEYGKSTATMRQGPNELTDHLGKLSAGKHTIELSVQNYGTLYAKGSFTIDGNNYSSYAKLHNEIAGEVAQSVTLPAAKMVNKTMAKEMEALLENAGWTDIYRINIIDKDWWNDLYSGGNSAVKSRHLAAAALAKGKDGFYYKVCTFHQDKLITGNFGKLYLSHQGDPVPVAKENIDK